MQSMKTTFDHLPDYKQDELRAVINVVLDMAKPDLLILFGSYARGEWVEEKEPDLPFYRFQSDFDLLAVVKNEFHARKIERREALRNELRKVSRTPVSLIAEDIHYINLSLSKARYFYVDIQKEGILLHDNGQLQLAEPVEMHPAHRRQLAQENYDRWFHEAVTLFEFYEFGFSKGHFNQAAFNLHQVTERLYAAILLVFTHYKPRTHDLFKIGERIHAVEPQFLTVFPKGTPEHQRRFELLRSAYVDARYTSSYTITAEELQWLAERVRYLQELTERLCREKIASFA